MKEPLTLILSLRGRGEIFGASFENLRTNGPCKMLEESYAGGGIVSGPGRKGAEHSFIAKFAMLKGASPHFVTAVIGHFSLNFLMMDLASPS